MTAKLRHPLTPRPLVLLLLLATSCDGLAPPTEAFDPQLAARLLGAQRVVLATVERVSAAFERNAYGDNLIVSTVTLRVHETLRGQPAPRVSFKLEGGAVGPLRLKVSDLPTLRPGERGLFSLRRAPTGSWVPNRRALGILRLASLPDAAQLRALRRQALAPAVIPAERGRR